jgi:hypothetical protein
LFQLSHRHEEPWKWKGTNLGIAVLLRETKLLSDMGYNRVQSGVYFPDENLMRIFGVGITVL